MNDVPPRLSAALSGRYRIERPLGEGGMATVYLAEDLKHDRKVALKVLKPELAAVVGAERFLAEIRTTANLQHPHILPLFDSGEAEGFLFYVMPFVEGETLHNRLERENQLAVDDAVRIASAVAGALDYAHRQGVVHRDIKPANILFQDGQPVVSDFGIALAVGAGSGARLTETGLSVGTPYYMSPEQATGDGRVGPASDVYALGCVLYEMLVGDPPYTGSTAQAVLGKILTGAAAAPREARPTIPANVDAAVRRSLEKVPADRFATGRDLGAALADPGFRHGGESPVEDTAARGLWNPLAISSTVLAAALAVILGSVLLRPEPPAPVTDVEVVLGDHRAPPALDLAPDGSFAVLARSPRTLIKRWASPGVELLSGDNLNAPRISPDGRNVVGWDGGVGETVVRSLVGEPDSEDLGARSYAWGADGSLYLLRGDTLWRRADPRGSSETSVATLRGTRGNLEILPDGRGALTSPTGLLEDAVIESVSFADGTTTTLVQGLTPRLAASGHLVYARADGMLMAAPFDPESRTLAGAPVATGRSVTIRDGLALFALDRRGTLLYRSGTLGSVVGRLIRMSADGRQEILTQGEMGEGVVALTLSPDGTRVAFRTAALARNSGLWAKALPDGPLTRLTTEVSLSGGISWSPDAAWVYWSGRGNDAWRVRADASRPAELFLDLQRPIAEIQVLPDGTSVVRTFPTGKDRDILVLEAGDSVPRDIFPSDADQQAPAVSPDGRWIAYQSSESGRSELFVQPFPRGAGRVQVSTGALEASSTSASRGRWGSDGRTLYFLDTDNVLVSVEITSDGGAPRASSPRVVLRPPIGLDWVGVFPDGSFLFAETMEEEGTMTLVLNFTEELKALAPR